MQFRNDQARQKIVKRAEAVGLDFEGEVAKLRGVDWETRLQAAARPDVQMPSYYTQPFHAYPEGKAPVLPSHAWR